MDQILSGLQKNDMFVYLDDIVICASSVAEHQTKFNKFVELNDYDRRILGYNQDKCEFLRKEVNYLGYVISEYGVKLSPLKAPIVKEFPRSQTSENIKQFLGLAGYYRRFIPNFSKIAKSSTNFLKKDEKFVWNEVQDKIFTELRDLLCSELYYNLPISPSLSLSGIHSDRRYIESRNDRKRLLGMYAAMHIYVGYLIRSNNIIPLHKRIIRDDIHHTIFPTIYLR